MPTFLHPTGVKDANPTAMRSRLHLKKLASVASIRLRGKVMAANRKTRHNNTVTSRHYGRHAIFVPGDVKFQDGDAFDLSKLGGGGGAFFHFYFVLSMFYLR